MKNETDNEVERQSVGAKQKVVNRNAMSYDLQNEWDEHEWRKEWAGLWYMKSDELCYMRWKWLGKYVTNCTYLF